MTGRTFRHFGSLSGQALTKLTNEEENSVQDYEKQNFPFFCAHIITNTHKNLLCINGMVRSHFFDYTKCSYLKHYCFFLFHLKKELYDGKFIIKGRMQGISQRI